MMKRKITSTEKFASSAQETAFFAYVESPHVCIKPDAVVSDETGVVFEYRGYEYNLGPKQAFYHAKRKLLYIPLDTAESLELVLVEGARL